MRASPLRPVFFGVDVVDPPLATMLIVFPCVPDADDHLVATVAVRGSVTSREHALRVAGEQFARLTPHDFDEILRLARPIDRRFLARGGMS